MRYARQGCKSSGRVSQISGRSGPARPNLSSLRFTTLMQDCEIFVEYDGDDELIPDEEAICPEILTASKVNNFRFITY